MILQKGTMPEFAGKHILIIIENLPAPFDRRVWQEASALKNNGADVSIICPKMKGYSKKFERIEGIDIYRHPLPVEGKGTFGYFVEYCLSVCWEIYLSWKIFFKKKFQVIHGCNPPDLIFITALFFKPFGVRYIFDHHDINPELYISKFNKKGIFYKLLLFLEKLTFKTANYSIATNLSYQEIAVKRGGMDPGKVKVVRSGPSLERLKILAPTEKYKNGREFLVGYVGVIGEQEGLDLLLEVAKIIINQRNDVQFGIVGGGIHLNKLKELKSTLGLEDFVDFYGRLPDREMLDILNTADVCVNPDKPTEMNNLSTMNKIMEYMALGKPIVQFDLKEGRFSAQDASLYARNNDMQDFANKIIELLENPELRESMSKFGKERVKNELSWEYEERKLIDLYKNVFI